jgi:pyridoxamine 5'-phosphate oxidase
MSSQTNNEEVALISRNLDQIGDPFALFADWLTKAADTEVNDHNAMALATVDSDGMPDVRMVLLKGFDETGFTFYTNLGSNKAKQLQANPKAALCFHWKSRRQQVRVRGAVSPVSDAEADAYFESRHRMSRIGAWASRQSQPLESRFALEKAVAAYTARYPAGPIPRPDHWSGFRIEPEAIEFWQDGAFRLHDRFVCRREGGDGWSATRLYP